MSAGCEIINSNVITINGGNGAYGGHMTSCSFNFGTLSAQGHRANVSLEGKNLGTPKIGESVSITILGSTFLFDVASYSKSSSARSMTTMSLNCVDISHRVLDNVHIILDEENEYTGRDVYKLGKKMLTVPDFVGPYMFPKPTTEWDSVTNVFPRLDPLVAPGKTRYGVKEDGKGGQTLDGIIQDIIEMPALVDISNIPLDFEGSLRNIITNLALQVGIVPVYDMTSNSIKVLPSTGDDDGSSFNLAAGTEKLEKIGGKCLVVSATEQEDFTSTEAQGAIGKTEFSPSGNSGGPKGGRDKGGKSTRFRKAYALNPDFHYSPCGKGSQDALKVLPFNQREKKGGVTTDKVTAETLQLEQALGCSADPKVWALFVLQCVLNEVNTAVPDLTVEAKVVGKKEDNEKTTTKWNLADALVTTPSEFVNTPQNGSKSNKLIADYYINGEWPCAAGEDKKNAGQAGRPVIVGVKIPLDEIWKANADGVPPQNPPAQNQFVQVMFKASEEKWAKHANKLPFNVLGGLNLVGLNNIGFMNGNMFLHSAGGFSTILNNDGSLDGETDYFRNYLLEITKFKNRVFIIEGRSVEKVQTFYPDGKKGYKAKEKLKALPTYDGIMLGTEAALGAANYKGPEGSKFESVNPYKALSKCDIGGLQELAKACYWMYVGNVPKFKCIEDFLDSHSMGKFLVALRDNTLKEFFQTGPEPESELQDEAKEKELEKAGKLWQVLLMIMPERDVSNEAFSSEKTTCNNNLFQNQAAGEVKNLSKDGAATSMTKMIYNAGADLEGSPAKVFGPAKAPIAVVADPNAAEIFAFGNNIPEKLTGDGYNLMVIQNSISMAQVVDAIQIRGSEVKGLSCEMYQKMETKKISETIIQVPTGELEKRCYVRAWYDHEQDPPAIGEGGSIKPTNRYVINAHSPIPVTWPTVWKTNLQKGFSVSPSDFEWEKHRDEEEDAELDYSYEGAEYNTKIIGRTKAGLDEIVEANTWVDSISSKSKSITIIADESLDFGSLPGVTEGLQSLDINLSGGKTTISITIGNTNYKQQMKMIRDANIKALEAGHRSSTLHKQKMLDNLKLENVFNIG